MESERLYTVNETFDVLKRYKITSNIESVRRWLRQGEIEGIAPASKKSGWMVKESALERFIASRVPSDYDIHSIVHTGNIINTTNVALDVESIRAAMWYEITRKIIWEGYVEIKKGLLKDAAEHRGYSQTLVKQVWERCVANSSAYKQPRVSYLLEAFSFEGERLFMDQTFTSKDEQIIFTIFEYVKSWRIEEHSKTL